MTEALMEPGNTAQPKSIQCNLCLQEITYNFDEKTSYDLGYIACPRCEYNQPLTNAPRKRDMIVFGATIAGVYITTIIAVILTR